MTLVEMELEELNSGLTKKPPFVLFRVDTPSGMYVCYARLVGDKYMLDRQDLIKTKGGL